MKARALHKPTLNERGFVRGIVIHNHVHVQLCWNIGFNGVEKLAEFLAAMAAMQFSDHLAGLGIEGRKQRGCAVAQIVVRTAFGLSWAHRQ